jgi:hypothetical protein
MAIAAARPGCYNDDCFLPCGFGPRDLLGSRSQTGPSVSPISLTLGNTDEVWHGQLLTMVTRKRPSVRGGAASGRIRPEPLGHSSLFIGLRNEIARPDDKLAGVFV